MKRLTFERQILFGVLLLGMGHLLWFLTDIGSFVNLAFVLIGVLFFFHPIPPVSASHHPKSRGYIRLAGVIFLVLGLTMHNGNGESEWRREVSGATGIPTRRSEVVSAMDDHGGFQGDGSTYIILDFSENPLTACPTAEGWRELPLTENVSALIYGSKTEGRGRSPQPREPVPQAEHGYWFFYDRQRESHSDQGVFDSYSYNYDFALYDGDRNLLYYFEYDT